MASEITCVFDLLVTPPVDGLTKLISLVDTDTLTDMSVFSFSALVKSATFNRMKPCAPSSIEEEAASTSLALSRILAVIDVAT